MNPTKPVLLLDCDGVLADFTKAVVQDASDYIGYGWSPPKITDYEIVPCLTNDIGIQGLLTTRQFRENWCYNIPVMAGAQEALAELSKLAEIHIVTSPLVNSKHWVHERTRWLETHFGLTHEQITFTHVKHRIHGDLFVDDKPAHVHNWTKYWDNPHSYLWAQEYNEHIEFGRISDWGPVLERLKTWQK